MAVLAKKGLARSGSIIPYSLLILVLFSLPTDAATLFSSPAGTTTTAEYRTRQDYSIVRTRTVHVNWEALRDAAGGGVDLVDLNLFEDVMLVARRIQNDEQRATVFVWRGDVVGDSGSQVTLVANTNVLVGNIRTQKGYYQIRYIGNGQHEVREIDENGFPPEGEPIPIYSTGVARDSLRSAADDGELIDVMVVYTPAARIAAGGTTAMNSLVELAITETNTAYSRSNVAQRLRLVHKQEVNYAETKNFFTDLDRLTEANDGFIDEVHGLRDQYAADLVSLWTDATSLCGLAWLMTNESPTFESFAFNVVAWTCATGNFSFGHELGHNMGLVHDRLNDPDDGVFAYSHGFFNSSLSSSFRTIMATQSSCPGCPRIQNFSNPNVNYLGISTGVSEHLANSAHVALSLNNTAETVANWRVQTVANPLTGLNFDGDREADLAVYEKISGNWFFLESTVGLNQHLGFGGVSYVPVPGDYDGDGKTDSAVYDTTTGNWFYRRSSDGMIGEHLGFGGVNYVPVPGDYDGDGIIDTAVYERNAGYWVISQTTAGLRINAGFGGTGFVPVLNQVTIAIALGLL